ncbi:MAG: hypothetical protein AAGA80_26710 [Cyanobacteria bacterium P01_F01_bin.143]
MAENSVKILLIEDDPAEARLLKEVLKNFNLQLFSLVHVNRLQTALEKIKCEHFDRHFAPLRWDSMVFLKGL